jgi:hypothetical protein
MRGRSEGGDDAAWGGMTWDETACSGKKSPDPRVGVQPGRVGSLVSRPEDAHGQPPPGSGALAVPEQPA